MHFLRDIIRLAVNKILSKSFKARSNLGPSPCPPNPDFDVRSIIPQKTNFRLSWFFRWWRSVFLYYDHWVFGNLGIDNHHCWNDTACVSSSCCEEQSQRFGSRICRTSQWYGQHSCKQCRVSHSAHGWISIRYG